MDLVPVAEPQSESELAVMLSLLEAGNIPAFVQNGGFGGLLPGPQIAAYNARRIVVPAGCAAEARAALADLSQPGAEFRPPQTTSWRDKLRMFLEFLFFGWFIPAHRTRKIPKRGPP